MNIKLDEKNYITDYAVTGDIDNSIKADIDKNLFEDYPSFLYRYENGKIILDEDKKEKYLLDVEKQKRIEKLEDEIYHLNLWLEDYDREYQIFERCKRLGTGYDKDIEELNKEALVKQNLLNELKSDIRCLMFE